MRARDGYRRRAADVAAFLQAYRHLVGLMMEVRKPGTLTVTEFRPKPDCDDEAAVADGRASKLAGRAVVAARGHEPLIGLDLPGRARTQFPLIQAWRYSLDYPWIMEPKYVISGIEQIIGALEAKADEAEARARTLAGRVAAFVSFPAAVRAAVIDDHPALGKAAYASGVLAQILVGVVIAVLGAGVIAGITSLWDATFVEPSKVSPSPATSP